MMINATTTPDVVDALRALSQFRGLIQRDETLAPHTAMRVGGITPLWLMPEDTASLIECLSLLRRLDYPFFVLGSGSNVVFPDGMLKRAVICTRDLLAITLTGQGRTVTCGAGVQMNELVDYCLLNALGGMETFAGLPGTVGGAAYMNARCYEREVADVLISAETLDDTGRIGVYMMNRTDWGYKKSPFQTGTSTVLSVTLAVTPLDGATAKVTTEHAAHYRADRIQKGHFKFPSAGSVFKNNHQFGKPSGKIIDEAGLRGYTVGNAQIAPWHGNLIINTGGATAADIKALIAHSTKVVFERFGYRLETEIILVQ
jgi:UDP-N-acetylmuramate dehydrogenase